MNDGMSPAVAGALRRGEDVAVPFDVIVNDEPVRLPAIHARGQFGATAAEFWILDDEANPLALRWTFGAIRLQAVKLSFPHPSSSTRLERELEGGGAPCSTASTSTRELPRQIRIGGNAR